MAQTLKNFWNSKKRQQLTDVRSLGLYIFALVVLAISWSGVKTIQANYELQKQVSTLQQQNEILKLQNGNTELQNKYYQTDYYLELAARQYFGLAAPGEKVLLVPKDVAMKYVDQKLAAETTTELAADNSSRYIKNFRAWRDFLLARKIVQN